MSIRSMTAFASAELATSWGVLSCELRAVNHRYLELTARLPDELRGFEPLLRERVAARVARGKVDVCLRVRATEGAELRPDPQRLRQLSALAVEVSAQMPGFHVEFTQLLQLPGVLQSSQVDAEQMQRDALTVLDAALQDFLAAREREGGKLANAIAERTQSIHAVAQTVRELQPQIRHAQRQKLEACMAELAQPAEPGRMEQELALWLQKLDVDEELDRLDCHVGELQRLLRQQEPVGRRMDFLLQEFNREANTLGSKSADVRTTNAAVELKVLIDQIREQVQNLE